MRLLLLINTAHGFNSFKRAGHAAERQSRNTGIAKFMSFIG